jgi:hypothetical protein
MGDFYITLQSDASALHYPKNTISNFRNRFAVPLKLDSKAYEVALVECCYVHSNVIVRAGEVMGYYTNVHGEPAKINPNRDIYTLKDLQDFLRVIKFEMVMEGGYVDYITPSIKWSSKMCHILGYSADTDTYPYPAHAQGGNTQMFLYCDIVDLQRVGNEMVPLLRKMDYSGEHGKVLTRSFAHLQYIDLSREEIDTVHMYIKNEDGENLPFVFGSFSATLHLRRKRY